MTTRKSMGTVAQLKAAEEAKIEKEEAKIEKEEAVPKHIKDMSFRELNDLQATIDAVKKLHMEQVNKQRLAWWAEVVKSLTPERKRMVVDWFNLLQKNESKTMALAKNGIRIPYGDGVHDILFNLQIVVKKVKKIETVPVTK